MPFILDPLDPISICNLDLTRDDNFVFPLFNSSASWSYQEQNDPFVKNTTLVNTSHWDLQNYAYIWLTFMNITFFFVQRNINVISWSCVEQQCCNGFW